MRILHTSDWHLGKNLENYQRIEEQKMFIEELEYICIEEKIELIIVAGDIYDKINPSIEAEKLFFKSMKNLSKICPIVLISGNHDSPNKLLSSKPLAYEFGIIVQGYLHTVAEVGKYDMFEIVHSGEGFFEIKIGDENAVIITLPYITEKSINEKIFINGDDIEQQKNYSNKIKNILDCLSKNYRKDTINLLVAHLFVIGSTETDSERKIQSIGGAYAVSSDVFPKNIQYVALGHLHKFQKVKNENSTIYYSGSPIRYSKSEANYDKLVLILDIEVGKKPIVTKRILTDYKPIYVIKCTTYEEAIEKCREKQNIESYVFLEINSNKNITREQIRNIRDTKKDIISIIHNVDNVEKVHYEVQEEQNVLDQFKSFYYDKKGLQASDDILNTFLEILDEIEKGDNECDLSV